MKNYLIGAVIALFVGLGVALGFLIHTKNQLESQTDYALMIIRDYAEVIEYTTCIENIAYGQQKNFTECEVISEGVLDDLNYYYKNFPLFFKDI